MNAANTAEITKSQILQLQAEILRKSLNRFAFRATYCICIIDNIACTTPTLAFSVFLRDVEPMLYVDMYMYLERVLQDSDYCMYI